MNAKDYIAIFILFYVGWFGSVFLGRTELAPVSLVFPVLLGGYLIYRRSFSVKDFVFVLAVSVFGSVIDSIFIYFGLVTMATESRFLVPVWLLSIWLLFSLSMLKVGSRINPHILIAAGLGAVMGPLSYKSGEYFQVLSFSHHYTFLIYAVFWAICFPVLLKISKRLA